MKLLKLFYSYLVIQRKLRIYNRYLKSNLNEEGYNRYFIYMINRLTDKKEKIKKEIIKRFI